MSSPLFLSDGLSDPVERLVLQTPDLEFQQHGLHARRASEIFPLGFVDLRPLDLEEGQAPPVDPAHLNRREFAATTDQPEGREKDVVGLDHLVLLPGPRPKRTCARRTAMTSGGEIG